MHPPSHDNHQPKPSKINVYDQVVIEELVECIVDVFNKDVQQYDDPFDNYIHQLRMRFQSNPHLFRRRMLQGYEALMDTLYSTPKD